MTIWAGSTPAKSSSSWAAAITFASMSLPCSDASCHEAAVPTVAPTPSSKAVLLSLVVTVCAGVQIDVSSRFTQSTNASVSIVSGLPLLSPFDPRLTSVSFVQPAKALAPILATPLAMLIFVSLSIPLKALGPIRSPAAGFVNSSSRLPQLIAE